MVNNLRLFDKSRIRLKINNDSVHSSFARSELNLPPENQAEDGIGQILLVLLESFL